MKLYMVRFALKFAFLSLLLAPGAYAADIIEVCEYHGGELNARSGQTWLGLFPKGNGQFETRATKVKVSMVRDEIEDDTPGAKTGKKVTINDKIEPLALISGVDTLKPGKVVTCTLNKKEHLDINQQLKLRLGTVESQLIVTGKVKEKDYRTNYKITLQTGGVKQTIVSHSQIGADTAPSLLWAGDLDGDGKLDLIMDTTNDYNARILTLFLSSKAKAGSLVKWVASHQSTGC